MTDRELMQMALDWIEAQHEPRMIGAWETIKALRTALAQPEPEPVAWMDSDGFPWTKQGVECRTTPDTYTPLYTAPPQREWKDLTTSETKALWNATKKPSEFAALLIAKFKEKNT